MKQRKPMKRTAMKNRGKKTSEWYFASQELKQEFDANGITECELGYAQCRRNNYLTWAHGKKRRHLAPGELKSLVILACVICHAVIERLPEDKMCAIVKKTIADRNRRLSQLGGSLGRTHTSLGDI